MRKAIGRLTVGLLALAPALADAATTCFTQAEQDAALLRQLRSEIMVISLTCRGYPDLDSIGFYDRFITKHRQPLQGSAKVMQAHFKRHYGADSSMTRLERYDTVLANNASNRNMDINRDGFCARSKSLLADAVSTDTKELVAFSVSRVSPANEMPLCGRPAPAARTAAVTPQRPTPPPAATPPPAQAQRAVVTTPPPPSLIGTPTRAVSPTAPAAPGERPQAIARPR